MFPVKQHAYAVDVMVDTVRHITRHNPSLFQRDSAFYAVTPAGFGKVSGGLSLTTQNPEQKEWRCGLPEITDSVNVLLQRGKENYQSTFIEGERERFLPLIFHTDSYGRFSLESMASTAIALSQLPDDGNIRMIGHIISYHSHKYGYAADGSDTWLTAARIMKCSRHLDIMRAREEQFLQALKSGDEKLTKEVYDSTGLVRVPNVFIITPQLMLTFPRKGVIDYHHDVSWKPDTEFSGEIPVYHEVCTYDRSPFALHATLNKRDMDATNLDDLQTQTTKEFNALTLQIDGLYCAMPAIELFLASLNAAHDLAFQKNIAWKESL